MIRASIVLIVSLLVSAYAYGQSAEESKEIFNYDTIQMLEQAKQNAESSESNLSEDRKGSIYSVLGIAYLQVKDYGKCKENLEKALKIHIRTNNNNLTVVDLMGLGGFYESIGYHEKAISHFELSLKINDDFKLGMENDIYKSLSLTYALLNNYEKAIYYTKKIEKVSQDGLIELGIYYVLSGRTPEAIKYYMDLEKAYKGKELKVELAKSTLYLGIVYALIGDYKNAKKSFDQAIEIYQGIKKTTKEMEFVIAHTWLDSVNNEDNYDKKNELLSWADKIYTESDIIDDIELGKLNLAKGKLKNDIKSYEMAIEFFKKSLQNDIREQKIVDSFEVHTGLGQAYESMQKYPEAGENYKQAIDIIEEQRKNLIDLEKERANSSDDLPLGDLTLNFLRTRNRFYEGMIRVCLNTNDVDKAFQYSEKLKARIFVESMLAKIYSLNYILPKPLSDEEEDIITNIKIEKMKYYYNQDMNAHQEKLSIYKARQDEFVENLRKNYPEYASIRYPQSIKFSEVKLSSNEAIVEFEVTDSVTYAFMKYNDKITSNVISMSRKELQKLIYQYLGFFRIKEIDQLRNYEPAIGKKLCNLLFGNLLKSIPANTYLIIIPDEFLGTLPFDALVTALPKTEKNSDGKYGTFPLGVKYLGDKYFISYAQSVTTFTLLQRLRKDKIFGENVLAVADPIFSRNDERLSSIDNKNAIDNNIDGNKKEFPRLGETEKLAKEIKQLFGNKTRVLIGLDANENELYKSNLISYRYIIFATHGTLDYETSFAREPAIVLTKFVLDNCDGFLTMSETMKLELNADVVALIGCSTGDGEKVSGEGVISMGRAFQFAGADNIVMSLWGVDQASSIQLTIAFFKYLKEGKEPNKALKLARLDIRNQGYEHPFYWAPFILLGN